MKIALLALTCLLGVTGCAPARDTHQQPLGPNNQPIPERNVDPMATLDGSAMKASLTQGHAIIRGQAFSKTRGGDVKYGAGNDILIVPLTGYVDECTRLVQSGFHSDCLKKIAPYVRSVSADGEGRFEIDHLMPGDYQLTTDISWEVPTGYGLERTGGPFTKVVHVPSDTDVTTTNLTP